MICPNCKYNVPSGMQYCPNCGNLLNNAQPSSSGMPTQRIDRLPAPQQRRITSPLEPLEEYPQYQEPRSEQSSTSMAPIPMPAVPQVVPRGTLPNTTYVVPAPRTNNTAIVSLVFGILGWFILPVIGPFVAIIAGHMALNQIKATNYEQEGRGMAIAGLILGYIQIIALVILCVVIALGIITLTQFN